ELGPLTVSMLRGEDGRQCKELEKLIRLLGDAFQPDLVHLNNALLSGVAPAIRRRLGVPVVCSLTGEDTFLDKLPSPHREEAWQLLRECTAEADALVALSRYFANVMAERLALPGGRIEVIPPGLNVEGCALSSPMMPARPDHRPFRVGFFSRIAPEKGLHLLAEAVGLLAKDASLPPVELHAAGYLDPAGQPYLAEVERAMAAAGLAGRFRYHGAPDRAGKTALLKSFDLFSLPTLLPESKGLPVLEAWANGVPAVLPQHGVFIELVEDTGGGLLHEPGSAALLAEAIAAMIRDPALAAACGRRAQKAVHERYGESVMATRTIELYRRTLNSHALPR
ncbi:MAG: glycosyltransferase family 4 protein, partial [Thermoguttaceae bacterium]|nr:glycosyltransferase family 4 protein [Thermoguttaceae bacterium]